MDGTCVEKETAPGAPETYPYGSIQFFKRAGGPIELVNNTLMNSGCRYAISVFGGEPLHAEASSGSYESGPSAATEAQDGFFCGAVHVHGDGRRLDLVDGVTFSNAGDPGVPKACVQLNGLLVVDDTLGDPFGPAGQFADYVEGSGGTVFLPEPTGPLPLALSIALLFWLERRQRVRAGTRRVR